MLTMAKPGVAKGLPRNPATVDQSKPNEPIPRPLTPEPICWAVTDFFQIKQTKEIDEIVGKR